MICGSQAQEKLKCVFTCLELKKYNISFWEIFLEIKSRKSFVCGLLYGK